MKIIKGKFSRVLLIPIAIALVPLLFLILRYPSDRDSLKVYYHAGTNALELFRTFDHFRNDPDERKFEAVKFLVKNMDQHYYLEDPYGDKKVSWYNIHFDRAITRLDDIEDSLETTGRELGYDMSVKKIRDARGICSEFLIEHIDQAFENWDSSRWSKHLSFGQFCEFMLPYKPWECKPQLWLEFYKTTYENIISSIPDSTSALDRIHILKDTADKISYHTLIQMRRKMTPIEMQAVRTGDCYYHSAWNHLIYLSQGFPTAELQLVNPANARSGHHWNALLQEDGTWKEFMKRGDSILIWPIVPSKIYVKHWGKQEKSFRALAEKEGLKEKDIPEGMSSWLLTDVTASIIPTTDVKVELTSPSQSQSPFAYLSVYDDGIWHPVHWAYPNGKTANFIEMGNNALYLPVWFESGQSYQAGPLFILRYNGLVEYPVADTSCQVLCLLDRVYPIKYYLMNRHATYMIGAAFEGSNDTMFQKPDTLLIIGREVIIPRNEDPELKFTETYDMWWAEQTVKTQRSYRYLRYRSASERYCYIGDVELLDEDGERISPVACFAPGENPEAICDGIYGEDYLHKAHGSWIVMDLGKPVKLSEIRYIPNDIDPASVQTGDVYKLSIWHGGDWKEIMKMKAANKAIQAKLYPEGMYLLENVSRFVHSRPFRYRSDKNIIEWW